MYNLKPIGLRLDESLCIQLDVKLKLKLKIIKIKMPIYRYILFLRYVDRSSLVLLWRL
jgi:hypothetical protein